jgi:hypothetical protein
MEYLLFALVLLPTFLVIGTAVVSLAPAVHAIEIELWETAAPRADDDYSDFVTNTAVGGTTGGIACPRSV